MHMAANAAANIQAYTPTFQTMLQIVKQLITAGADLFSENQQLIEVNKQRRGQRSEDLVAPNLQAEAFLIQQRKKYCIIIPG